MPLVKLIILNKFTGGKLLEKIIPASAPKISSTLTEALERTGTPDKVIIELEYAKKEGRHAKKNKTRNNHTGQDTKT